jgi:hypothetical protein
MSLYLLAILQHGIVIAFARKTDFALRKFLIHIEIIFTIVCCLDKLEDAIKKLFTPQIQKQPSKRKAVEDGQTKTKRTRRTTTATALEPVQEEVEGEEQLIDLRNLPTEEISDRLRVGDLRQVYFNSSKDLIIQFTFSDHTQ